MWKRKRCGIARRYRRNEETDSTSRGEDIIRRREIAQLEREDTIKGNRIEGLKHRLATITSSSKGHWKIRSRFLDVQPRFPYQGYLQLDQ